MLCCVVLCGVVRAHNIHVARNTHVILPFGSVMLEFA